MSKIETKRLLSVDEAAEYFGCHSDTMRRHIRAGTIPSLKLGRISRISRIVLDDLIDSQAKLPTPPRNVPRNSTDTEHGGSR